MFDSLKEKLGSFRKDVEETAEEKAEPLEEDDLEELDDGAVDASTDTEPEDESEPRVHSAGEPDPESPPDPDSAPAPDPDLESPPTPAAETEPEPESKAEAEPQREPESESESSSTHSESPLEREDTDAGAAGDDTADDQPEDSSPTFGANVKIVDVPLEGEDDEEENTAGFGRKAKSLARGKFVIEEEDLAGPLQELELALLSSDVEMGVAEEILENIEDELVGETRRFTESTGGVVEEALGDAILDVISVGQFDFDERLAVEDKPLVIVFTGVNGVGKTTSIAKLSQYLEERGYSSVMANGDTYRAGANEQIREHAEALGTKLITHDQGGDPAAVLYDAVEYAKANDVDVVLGDTAGRLHTNEGLMDQLEKINRVVDPDMALFVDEAVAGQDAVNRAREFNEVAPFDGAILTKADADSNGGAAISIAHVTGQPILFLGVGQGYDDLERFDPERMVERLLEVDDEE